MVCEATAPAGLVGALLLLALLHSAAATPLTIAEARSLLDRWNPEVHGAVAVKVGDVPYQASIRLHSPEASQHRCGGAIISPWHILTAARCVTYSSSPAMLDVFVVVGSVKRSSLDEGDVDTVVRKVARISRHPEYSPRDYKHDLAVFTLNKALPKDRVDRIASVPLPVGDIRVEVGTTCVVSGWGNHTGRTMVETDALLSAEVPFIGRDLCSHMYEPTNLPEGVVCTAHQKGGAGACVCTFGVVLQGDPGGPVVCNGFLAGAVSWGAGCGANARPTVLTSLMDHVEWVRHQMEPPGSHYSDSSGNNVLVQYSSGNRLLAAWRGVALCALLASRWL